MRITFFTFMLLLSFIFLSCNNSSPVQIGQDTFVDNEKVYKLIDNELTEISNLNDEKIRKFEVLKPQTKTLGEKELSHISSKATAKLDALYRGNFLYFNLTLSGINDLKEEYYPGILGIQFMDEFGFLLHFTEITTSELIGIVDKNGDVDHFEYSGKTEMSTEINKAIVGYSVTSTIRPKRELRIQQKSQKT